jgi:hypothetical protein
MMGEQAMRLMQIRQRAQAAAEEVKAQKRQRQANQSVLQAMMLDDMQFQSALPTLTELLPDASPDLQRGLMNRGQTVREVESAKRELETFKARGVKLDERNAQRFERLGITVPTTMMLPTIAQQKEAQEQTRKEGLLVLAMDQGLIDPSEMDRFMQYADAGVLDDALEMRGAQAKAQQAQQEAAAKQAATKALEPALARYRAGNATDADLIALKDGGLVTASNIGPNKPMENPLVFAEKQAERVDGEIQRIEQELLNQGVATKEKGAFRLDEDKVKEGDGKRMIFADQPPTPEYARRQELLAQRDQLIKQREAIGAALVKQQLGPIIAQLEAQLGRKPTRDEVRAALGAPRSTQASPQPTQ